MRRGAGAEVVMAYNGVLRDHPARTSGRNRMRLKRGQR